MLVIADLFDLVSNFAIHQECRIMNPLENSIINLLGELVRINSVNLTLSQGPGESEVAEFIRHRLEALKLRPQIQTIALGRNNVIAVVSGTNPAKSLLLNGHLDTVSVEGMDDPFRLRQEGDRLFGRGTYDMKGSLAVMLMLAEYFSTKLSMPRLLSSSSATNVKIISMGGRWRVKYSASISMTARLPFIS